MTLPPDNRRDATEVLIALGLNVLFLALTVLLFWPLGQVPLALLWAKGYAVYWLAVVVSVLLLTLLERLFRIDPEEQYTIYVGGNMVVSVVLVLGWSAFAALAVDGAADAVVWVAGILYLVGGLTGYAAFVVATAFYKGVAASPPQLPAFCRMARPWVGPLRLVLCVFRDGQGVMETHSGLFGKTRGCMSIRSPLPF